MSIEKMKTSAPLRTAFSPTSNAEPGSIVMAFWKPPTGTPASFSGGSADEASNVLTSNNSHGMS
jgi:hypothetical protein